MDVAAPLEKASRQDRPRRPDPCAFVIFGAGGDLTKRLLFPALYNLAAANLLPDGFAVIGIARQEISDAQFRDAMAAALHEFATTSVSQPIVDRLLERLRYIRGDFNDASTYDRLKQALARAEREFRTGRNALFYLATPPDVFATIAEQLGRAGLARAEGGWRRIIVEKPFGTDLISARELNAKLRSVFSEDQIYRIDHYLGKETVQNIMVMRFANGLFEPL